MKVEGIPRILTDQVVQVTLEPAEARAVVNEVAHLLTYHVHPQSAGEVPVVEELMSQLLEELRGLAKTKR